MNFNYNQDTGMKETVSNFFSSIKSRSAIEPDKMYTKFPKIACVPEELKMDYTRLLAKPFFIKSIPWVTTDTVGTELFKDSGGDFIDGFNVPTSLQLNQLARLPFFSSVLYRCKVKLIIQVAGTPMHQGCILFGVQPAGFRVEGAPVPETLERFNSLMAGPHVFAFANECTAVTLEVPFYFNTKLGKTDLDGQTIQPNFTRNNYAQVLALVLNPLQGPTGASTRLTFSVHAEYSDMEFYIPHTDPLYAPTPPTFEAQGFIADVSSSATAVLDSAFTNARNTVSDFLDVGRGFVRKYTGLDANNFPSISTKEHVVSRQVANVVDMPKQFEKLDPYGDFDRVCSDYLFDTERDEMLVREIITKPQYIGTFRVQTTNGEGDLCWARPMCPVQQQKSYTYTNSAGEDVKTAGWDNFLQTMYFMTRYWKGSIKIHIQSVMSNFHYCKLIVARDYSIRQTAFTQYPALLSIPNLLTETLEFSAGGQVQTVELPFAAPTDVLPNTTDWNLMAAQMGMYYIYLAQPLTVNGTVVSSAQFNVFISAGDDFNYYGYSTTPLRILMPHTAIGPPSLAEELIDLQAQGDITQDSKVPEGVGMQKSVTFQHIDEAMPYDAGIMRPLVSVRDMLRRFYISSKINISPEALKASHGLIRIDVAEELGIRPLKGDINLDRRNVNASTLRLLNHMFLGYAGGARFKIVVNGNSSATAWFVPPGFKLHGSTVGNINQKEWASTLPTSAQSSQVQTSGYEIFSPVKFGTGHPEYSVQTVTQELPNIAVPQAFSTALYTGNNDSAGSYSLLEVEVPNLSPFRFVGDYTSKLAPDTYVTATTPTSNLGYIMVFVPQQIKVDGATAIGGVSVTVYTAADDTARLGYQVHSPTVMFNAAIVGGGSPQPDFTIAGVDYGVPGTALVSSRPDYTLPFYTRT